MRKFSPLFLLITLLLSFPDILSAQTFLNGDFELNNATLNVDEINLSNEAFNQNMKHCYAFGSYGDMDIISTATYNGLPKNGSYFVAFTGGGTDAISMELSEPLKAGKSYTISFWDRASSGYVPQPFMIGISNSKDQFGTEIYTAGTPQSSEWTERVFTFVAPEDARYITVQLSGANNIGDWAQTDHFRFLNPEQKITTLKVSPTDLCACTEISVPFRSEGIYLENNEYKVELSDAHGNFENSMVIGSLISSRNDGTISCSLPCELAAGSAYRVRVISTLPSVIGSDNGDNLRIGTEINPEVSIFVNLSGEVQAGTQLTFSSQIENAGSRPQLKWLINGEEINIRSSSFSSNTLKDGDIVSLMVISTSTCSGEKTNLSNEIIVHIETPPAPAVTIRAEGATSIKKGEVITFVATPVNGGSNPRYQWKVNGNNTGSGTSVFTTSALKDGDQVSVVITSSEEFLSHRTAESNIIGVSVAEPEKPLPIAVIGEGTKSHAKHTNRYYMYVFKSNAKGHKGGKKSKAYKAARPDKKNINHCHRF